MSSTSPNTKTSSKTINYESVKREAVRICKRAAAKELKRALAANAKGDFRKVPFTLFPTESGLLLKPSGFDGLNGEQASEENWRMAKGKMSQKKRDELGITSEMKDGPCLFPGSPKDNAGPHVTASLTKGALTIDRDGNYDKDQDNIKAILTKAQGLQGKVVYLNLTGKTESFFCTNNLERAETLGGPVSYVETYANALKGINKVRKSIGLVPVGSTFRVHMTLFKLRGKAVEALLTKWPNTNGGPYPDPVPNLKM